MSKINGVEPLVTITDVAEQLGLNRDTIARWIAAEQFARPVIRTANRVYFRPSDVRNWLQKQAEGATA